MHQAEFWKHKSMAELTQKEWESLCDGCAKCCVFKFEEEETGHILQTDVVCKLLDLETCHCTKYQKRNTLVPDCITITAENILSLKWMPSSCAYRLVALREDLPTWHPLVSKNSRSTIEAAMTVQGRVVSESEVDDIEEHIIGWFDPNS